ncbi:MAG: portal protein [Pontimonas sp.]
MAVELKPFDLEQMQNLVRHHVSIMDLHHQRWRLLEAIYRTGSLQQAEQYKPGQLQQFMPRLSEHTVNMVLPHLNIIMASVVSRDPLFMSIPYKGGEDAEKAAAISDAVINYFWRRLRVTRELRDATADAVKLGSGFLKVGWNHLENEMELDGMERRERAMDMYQQERLKAIMEEREFEGNIELMERSVPSSEMRVIKSEPFVEYVSPYDLFVPSNARRMEDARWVCHRVTLPVDEVLSNPEFDVSESDIIRDGMTINPADEYQAEWRRQAEDAKGIYASSEALDTATLWEFYDMRTRKLTVFQLEASEPLWEGDLPWSHRYPPFVHIRNFTSAGHDFWGFGDLENIANLQNMLNEMFEEQIENARRSGQKYLVRSDALTDDLMAALESSESDVVAPVEVPNGEPLDQIIVPVFRQALAGDVYAAKDQLQNYMREVLGINDFQAGGVGANRMSATAAAVVEGVATLRAQDKIQSIEDGAAHVGNLILLLCQEYLDEPTAIRIAGEDGVSWPQVSKNDLYGEFLVSVEGGSMKAINPATREQQGLRTLTQVVPMLAQMQYDPTPALRMALRDLGYNPDDILVPAQMMQQAAAAVPGASAEAPTSIVSQMGGPPTAENAQMAGGLSL